MSGKFICPGIMVRLFLQGHNQKRFPPSTGLGRSTEGHCLPPKGRERRKRHTLPKCLFQSRRSLLPGHPLVFGSGQALVLSLHMSHGSKSLLPSSPGPRRQRAPRAPAPVCAPARSAWGVRSRFHCRPASTVTPKNHFTSAHGFIRER